MAISSFPHIFRDGEIIGRRGVGQGAMGGLIMRAAPLCPVAIAA